MFHSRQLAPGLPAKYFGLYGCSGEGPSHWSQCRPAGGGALGFEIPVARELAVAPSDGGLQVADRAVADHFLDPRIVVLRVHLGADLAGEFAFFAEPIFAEHAGFFDTDGAGFFAIDVEVTVERPIGNEGVVVVGGADHHGI